MFTARNFHTTHEIFVRITVFYCLFLLSLLNIKYQIAKVNYNDLAVMCEGRQEVSGNNARRLRLIRED